jgi:hypothetical protein
MNSLPSRTSAASTVSVDAVCTDPTLYTVVFENQRVRVLRYRDRPGDKTSLHQHPDMVLVPLSNFRRRLTVNGHSVDLEKTAFDPGWVPAQAHVGENVGTTDTHVLLIELR